MTLSKYHGLPQLPPQGLFGKAISQHLQPRISLCLCIGLLAGVCFSAVLSGVVMAVVTIALVLVVIAFRRCIHDVVLLMTIGLAMGVSVGIPQFITTQKQLAQSVSGEGELTAHVLTEPKVIGMKASLVVSVDRSAQLMPGTKLQIMLFDIPEYGIYRGQTLLIQCKWLAVPNSPYGVWLRRRGIFVQSTIGSADDIRLVPGVSLLTCMSRIRTVCIDGLTDCLPGRVRGLVKGISLGDTSDMSSSLRDNLANSGIIHIMSPSGLHVSVVFGFTWLLLGLLTAPRSWRIVLSIVAVWAYALVCGGESPVLRSAVMCSAVGLAQCAHRDRDALSSCAVAAMAILIWQPYSIFDPSFQMSFVMVCCIIAIANSVMYHHYQKRLLSRWLHTMRQLLLVGILCAAAAIPLSAYYFNRISIISPITNILVAFPVSIITCFAPLVGWLSSIGVELHSITGGLLRFCAEAIMFSADWACSIPGSSMKTATPSVQLLIVYYSCYGSLLVIVRQFIRKRHSVVA